MEETGVTDRLIIVHQLLGAAQDTGERRIAPQIFRALDPDGHRQ